MLTLALFCIACALYWVMRAKIVKTTEPPSLPGGWPILGHAPYFIGDSCTLWQNVQAIGQQVHELGGVASVSFGFRNVYIVTDPEDFATVAYTCLDKQKFYGFAKPWLGDRLATGKLSIWKTHRKLLNPAFNQSVLDNFIGVFNGQARKLVKYLEKEVGKGLFDVGDYTRHVALESICLTMIGVDFTDSALSEQYVEAVEEMMGLIVERFLKYWWHSPYTFAWSNLKKKQDACLKILHNMSDTVLQRRKSEFTGNVCAERSVIPGSKFKAFMDLLLELSLEKGVLNDKQIREHVDTMIVAGQDTTATVLMYVIILLGSHPEVQEKAFAEILEVIGDGDYDVQKTDLSKLVYLEAVLKESMRVLNITPIIARKLDQDVQLKNCTLSARRSCFLFAFGVHAHPIWGPDRHEFKPERWLDPNTLPDHPNAFAAFSMGRRQCIGRVYAIMTMKTSLVHLLRNYKISADYHKMRLKLDCMLKPDSGHLVSIERRMWNGKTQL